MRALEIVDLCAGYRTGAVLQGVSLHVDSGSCVAVLARNGVGKTTLAAAVAGWLPAKAERLEVAGRSLLGLKPYQIARQGLGLVPQGRRLFPRLTVRENLMVAATLHPSEVFEMVVGLFPVLKDRLAQIAGTLSGGEQQMLAVGRALMSRPRVLLLDEPTEGLAPKVIDEVLDSLLVLKSTGVSMLLLEQRLDFALNLADTVVVMATGGRVIFTGSPGELRTRSDIQVRHLGISDE